MIFGTERIRVYVRSVNVVIVFSEFDYNGHVRVNGPWGNRQRKAFHWFLSHIM